ncbi:hypothetical protein D3C78_1554780 [compost metagenome]
MVMAVLRQCCIFTAEPPERRATVTPPMGAYSTVGAPEAIRMGMPPSITLIIVSKTPKENAPLSRGALPIGVHS